MSLNADLREFVELLNSRGVEYVIVGAHRDFAEADFTVPEQMIQLGRAPNRIDLLTSISGVLIEDAFHTKIFTEMEGLPVFILNKELLIQNKRAVGHPQDVADLRELEGS